MKGQGKQAQYSGNNPQSLRKPSENLIEKENFEIHPDGTTYSGQMKIVKRDDNTSGKGGSRKEESNSETADMVYIPHGYGTLKWPDGASYTGEIRDGKANGKGKFSHANGDSYEGEFVND